MLQPYVSDVIDGVVRGIGRVDPHVSIVSRHGCATPFALTTPNRLARALQTRCQALGCDGTPRPGRTRDQPGVGEDPLDGDLTTDHASTLCGGAGQSGHRCRLSDHRLPDSHRSRLLKRESTTSSNTFSIGAAASTTMKRSGNWAAIRKYSSRTRA